MKSINPATGQLISNYQSMDDYEVVKRIGLAKEALVDWKELTIVQRSDIISVVGDLLLKNKQLYAQLITDEMGKVIRESIAEIEKCAKLCKYYAANAIGFLQDEIVVTEAQKSYVAYKPLGVVLAVMPWNFPFWQAIRAAIPAIISGNVVILKHASNVSGCSLALEKLFEQADLPKYVFNSFIINSSQVAKIIENKSIAAVSITGSEKAGKAIASKAGECLKKVVLELGGSDAYIILEDANLNKAADICVQARFINAGQSCISPKRIIVCESVYEQFLDFMLLRVGKIQYGDPNIDSSNIGPLVNVEAREYLHQQVVKSIEQGADCLIGGQIPIDKQGAFYPPTILTNIQDGMPAYNEELFGPVISIIKVTNEGEAIKIANDTHFGLGGAVFTNDLQRGEDLARNKINSGSCCVNDFVRSDPRLPFGGINYSGYGRELSHYGIKEFVNIKAISLQQI